MKKFYIIANLDKEYAGKTRQEICDYLESRGGTCLFGAQENPDHHTDSRAVPEDTDCIITIGGDGTLIQAARDLAGRSIPMVGINRGHLGFLTQVSRQEDIGQALEALLSERYSLERRMMVLGSVIRQDREIFQDIALNEIAVTRPEPLKVLRFEVLVNDEYLNQFAADGVLVATPTGSTAYNLSAGGPVMAPAGRMMVMTPICPHTLNGRSIVLSAEDQVRIHLLSSGRVAFDGDSFCELEAGDEIRVEKSALETVMVKVRQISFMQNLSNHLG